MCGRYLLETDIEQLKMRFDAKNNYLGYNSKKEIFPSNTAAAIIRKGNENIIEGFQWGINAPKLLINARVETVSEKPTFKNLFLYNRCIIPATGFFEWKSEGKEKNKFQIYPNNADIFGMAGLYKSYMDEAGNKTTHFVIITTEGNEEMCKIHDRMPAILTKNNENLWLDNSIKDIILLKELMKSDEVSLCFKNVELYTQTKLF
jgi:putative SOS response-associated peptidase YedK